MISIEFLLAATIVALIPGSGVIYTLSIAITSNRKNMFYAVLGCTIGIVPHIILALSVLFILISINNYIYIIVKYLGVVYLLYIAYELYISKDIFAIESYFNKKKIFTQAITINLLNPKLSIFLISFIPQYMNTQYTLIEFITLSIVFMLITFIIFILYGLLAETIKSRFIDTKEKNIQVQKLFSYIFILLCIQIIFNV